MSCWLNGLRSPKRIARAGRNRHPARGRSKSAGVFRDTPFDVIVTVCDDAAENCPVWLGRGKRIHLGFPDPAKTTGDDEQVMAVFRAVRDDMLRRGPALLKEYENL